MSENKAIRFNDNKPKITFILEMPNAINGIVRVLEFGAEKYSRGNFLKGFPYTEVSDSLMRHLLAFLNGEDLDKETNLPHVDHIACNALFLSEFFVSNKDKDDRISKQHDIDIENKAFNAAIDFAILDDEPRAFLLNRREGNWGVIAEEWPEFDLNTIGQ